MTGPKISFWIELVVLAQPGDHRRLEEEAAVALAAWPPASTSAWSGIRSKNAATRPSWLALFTGPNSASSSSGAGRVRRVVAGLLGQAGHEVVVDARRRPAPG